jgi:YrhK-like protein
VPGFASLVGATADNATYFIGSLCFTAASFTQWFLSGRHAQGRWRSPAWSDWWAAAVQFPGTLFFNVSTLSALIGGADVWRPDALGSICFLVSSGLALQATVIRDRLWDPSSRTWETAWLNLLGSVAFGVSAIAAYVVPGSGEVATAALVNLGTFLGAVCFFAGALLMTPDPRVSTQSA